MSTAVVIGAGISGHTAALTLRHKLKKQHRVVVISPNRFYQWVPSNIWIAAGRMGRKDVIFELEPVYRKLGIEFIRAKALSFHPEGDDEHSKPFVKYQLVESGEEGTVEYDYLINATGPKLNFAGTPGLGPDGGYTYSVCTYEHAEQTWEALNNMFDRMKNGEKKRFVIGLGHPKATCQGAAFEFTLNVAHEIHRRGLWDKAEIIYLTNEYELGDFGMGGAFVRDKGHIIPTSILAESILTQYGVNWIKRAGVKKVDGKKIYYETLDGQEHELEYDFAMLIPGFTGVGLKAYDKQNNDITDKIFKPNGFMVVDADYTPKPYEEWSAADWPEVYQNPDYPNMFATGIAFAPPHAISKQLKSPNGTVIAPAPPRTGMPSSVIGKTVALNVAESINKGKLTLKHKASMARMGAVCVISAGYGLLNGMAATMTVFPIVPDFDKYPEWGRSLTYTLGEQGLAGHWFKWFTHYMFLYKAKAKPFWWLIPE